MQDIIKSYTVAPKPNARKCDGCGIIIGPEAPQKVGLMVTDGPCRGFFHNHQCFLRAQQEMVDAGAIDEPVTI